MATRHVQRLGRVGLKKAFNPTYILFQLKFIALLVKLINRCSYSIDRMKNPDGSNVADKHKKRICLIGVIRVLLWR
ncbi:hypothetical protein CRENPOLYSF2_3090004 [Crenothrix polyspora]|uniref:Uncharacterized protein n=1 Tax=Crenothrix polyspora TaxID=360316 RepID=A0A1R4HA32_9GAMM|nr:hypothetical protein CRENPOLYSF2_3090004 [Crenothrix polyspora]